MAGVSCLVWELCSVIRAPAEPRRNDLFSLFAEFEIYVQTSIKKTKNKKKHFSAARISYSKPQFCKINDSTNIFKKKKKKRE